MITSQFIMIRECVSTPILAYFLVLLGIGRFVIDVVCDRSSMFR